MADSVSPAIRDLLAMHLTPGLGPIRAAALLEHFGSAAAVLRAAETELRQVAGIGEQLARALTAGAAEVEKELAWAARTGVELRALGQPGYPPWLAEIPGAPTILYLRGSLLEADS